MVSMIIVHLPNTPSVILVFKIKKTASCLFTAVRGQWTPLVELVELCGFTVDRQDGEVSIATPFITCGVAVMVSFSGNDSWSRFFHYSYSDIWREVKSFIFVILCQVRCYAATLWWKTCIATKVNQLSDE